MTMLIYLNTMDKRLFFIIIMLLGSVFANSQSSIKGSFTGLAKTQIKLIGYSGFHTYIIDSTQTNDKGVFGLSFTKNDYGIGYLVAEDGKPFIIILADEDLKIKGEVLSIPQSIEMLQGKQNKAFGQYASEHPRREQALSAWDYLQKIYEKDTLFAGHKEPAKAIIKEKKRIKAEDSLFLSGLDSNAYVSWYLPLRKLISSVSTIAQYRTKEIPATIAAFRTIDYAAPRLYKSGLLADVIESHFWLIENSGRSLDSVFIEMNRSIDIIIETLLPDEQKLNEIGNHLFKLLEKRSLFRSSEYLALKLLNEQGCTLDDDLSNQLEHYRAMKIGNIASDFAFEGDVLSPENNQDKLPAGLSDIKSKYKVVVFGASWCPACPSELAQIAASYKKWKSLGVDVVFVSLDEDETVFKEFAVSFPFTSVCDYKKWKSPAVEAYHIFATPTMYLLDENNEILLRPVSADHINSWVDWVLAKGR